MRARTRFVFALALMALIFQPASRLLFGQDRDKDQDSPQSSPGTGKTAQARYDEDGEGKEKDFVKKRMQWFHDQRAYPHQTIPGGIRARAIQERDRKLAIEASARQSLAHAATTPAEPAWTLIGPEPEDSFASGRVTALAIDPTNTKIVYLGGAEGGVWKTVNAGQTWTPLGDAQVSLAIGSIAIDPSNHNTIYVGTGEENFAIDNYYGAGILKSTNGGATWTQIAGSFTGNPCGGDYVGAVAVHPTNSQIILAGAEPCYYGASSIFRSTDGGLTWTAVYTDSNGWIPATNIVFDHSNGNIVYAATNYGGVLKSTDAGVTWNPANGTGTTALPTSNVGRIAIAMTPSNPSILYAAVADTQNSDLIGLYKTVDSGSNWTLLPNTPDFCATQCWYDIVLAVSPSNPNLVAAGGVFPYHPGGSGVVTSLDGGNTWFDQSNFLHPDTHALAFTPDGSTLFVGSDGGVWSTANPGASGTGAIAWSNLNSSLAITEFYPGLAMDPTNVNHSTVGTQDNGSETYSGTLDWTENDVCGDGGPTAIDYTNPTTTYANCIEESLYKSTLGGPWENVTAGLQNDRTSWVPPLAMDAKNPNNLYFGTYRVYQTTNGATLWNPISPDLTGAAGESTLNTIAVAPTDSNTVYTGAGSSTIYVTRNALAGASSKWTEVSSASLPDRSVNWIAVDPASATTAYVGFSGFTGYGDSLGHIFQTTDAGAAWKDISSDLPNTPVDAILVDPDAPSTIFIGTDIGAFYTTNTGASWSRLGTGLPNVVVTGLGLHEASRTLRASTHGRSTWDLNISTLLTIPTVSSLSQTTFTADSAAVKLTVKGSQFVAASAVVWNGAALTTTFVNSGEVTATVPTTDLLEGGTATVGVLNGAAGKLSNLTTVTIDNPVPAATALSTSSVKAGSAAFTLKVTGSNFVKDSKIEWNGVALTTAYAGTTSLSASIPAVYLSRGGTAAVTIENPSPGGGASKTLTFTIDNPVPIAGALSPLSSTAGSAAETLTVTGSSFVSGAKIVWNGTPLLTDAVNSTKLTANLPGADQVTAGTAVVTVTNPAPGGGAAAAKFTFTIKNPVPAATKLSPVSAKVGGASFTLIITGSNFIKASQVKWNGTALTTAWHSATEVEATVPSTDLSKAATALITVTNPTPGGGTTAAISFPVQ